MTTKNFGKRIKRNEDPILLTGQALFTDDVDLPNMGHVAFVRSPHAHARITNIDTSFAEDKEGVLAIYTAESLGDYCAGANHVLPTSGTARFSSPLGVYDFQKRSSLIEVSEAGAQTLGRIAAELAYGEGLQAHARAAELRLTPVPPMREST